MPNVTMSLRGEGVGPVTFSPRLIPVLAGVCKLVDGALNIMMNGELLAEYICFLLVQVKDIGDVEKGVGRRGSCINDTVTLGVTQGG